MNGAGAGLGAPSAVATKRPPPSHCNSSRLQLFGVVAALACAASIAAVGSLAIARPDLSISSDPISEYVHGPYSFVQIAVFFAVGVSSAGIALGLLCVLLPTRLSRLAAGAMAVWAVGMIIAGVVDVEDRYFGTSQGAIHDATVIVAFSMLLVSALTTTRTRTRSPTTDESAARTWSFVSTGWALAIAVTLLLSGLLDGTPWFGLTERALALVAVSWLIYLGVTLRQVSLAGLAGLAEHPERSRAGA